jgi:hypothetical protein
VIETAVAYQRTQGTALNSYWRDLSFQYIYGDKWRRLGSESRTYTTNYTPTVSVLPASTVIPPLPVAPQLHLDATANTTQVIANGTEATYTNLGTVNSDTGSGWNAGTGIYTVPAGVYSRVVWISAGTAGVEAETSITFFIEQSTDGGSNWQRIAEADTIDGRFLTVSRHIHVVSGVQFRVGLSNRDSTDYTVNNIPSTFISLVDLGEF